MGVLASNFLSFVFIEDGESSVNLKLVANNGTIFDNQKGTVSLSAVAFKGTEDITSKATYTWYRNGELISGVTNPTYSVSATTLTALVTKFQCVMLYDNHTYTDIISIENRTDISTSVVAPSDPKVGDVWLDTSIEPPVFKRYYGTEKGWLVIGDVTEELKDIRETTETNKADITKSNKQIEQLIERTTVVKLNGNTISMQTLYNETIDTAEEHSRKLSKVDTVFDDLGVKVDENESASSNVVQRINLLSSSVYDSRVNDKTGVVQSIKTIAEQTADKFTWLVDGTSSSSSITLTENFMNIISTNLDIEAITTFIGTAKDGSTTIIDGGSIKANSISASKLDVKTLSSINSTLGNVTVGGLENINGSIQFKDSDNVTFGTFDNRGILLSASVDDIRMLRIGTSLSLNYNEENATGFGAGRNYCDVWANDADGNMIGKAIMIVDAETPTMGIVNEKNTYVTRFSKTESHIGTDLTVSKKIYENGSRLLGMQELNTYWGMIANGANDVWIRTTSKGLLPYQNSSLYGASGSLGTSAWQFKSAYAVEIFENGKSLAEKYAPVSHGHWKLYNGADGGAYCVGMSSDSLYFRPYVNATDGTTSGDVSLGSTSHCWGNTYLANGKSYCILDSTKTARVLLTMNSSNNVTVGTNSVTSTMVLKGNSVRLSTTTGTVVTSDERFKKEMSSLSLDERYDNFFMDVDAKIFKYLDGTSDRFHVGVSAQGVLESLTNNGLSTQDFGGFVTTAFDPDGYGENSAVRSISDLDNVHGIIYNEFIGLNINATQKNRRMIQDLQSELANYKNELEALKEELLKLKS